MTVLGRHANIGDKINAFSISLCAPQVRNPLSNYAQVLGYQVHIHVDPTPSAVAGFNMSLETHLASFFYHLTLHDRKWWLEFINRTLLSTLCSVLGNTSKSSSGSKLWTFATVHSIDMLFTLMHSINTVFIQFNIRN